ncbi:MAG: sel1 repeat family protein [Verrucomicrobia bacterium]|nr:sel1 repeat family protein [Verrucomicrobiota bacterium]
MTILEIVRTAMGMPPPRPEVAEVEEPERMTPLSNDKLSAGEFRSTLELAEAGDLVARRRVGFLYYRGLGVRVNHPQAFKWLTLAAEQNDTQAFEGLKVLMLGMTPDDLALGRRLVARYKGEPEPDFSEPAEGFESPEESPDAETSPDRDRVTYGFSAWQPGARTDEIRPAETPARPVTAKLPAAAPALVSPPVAPRVPEGRPGRPARVITPVHRPSSRRWVFAVVLLALTGGGTWYYWNQTRSVTNTGAGSGADTNSVASLSMPGVRLLPATGVGTNAALASTNLAAAPTNQDRRSLIESLRSLTTSGRTGSPPPASELPVEKLAEQAARGSADAQFLLGLKFAEGKGVPQDFTNAVILFTRAAEQGQADAQNNLAICLGRGTGVKKDYVEAYKWISLAIAGGNREASANRDMLARLMKPEDVQRARQLAVEFVNRTPPKPGTPASGSPENKPSPPP